MRTVQVHELIIHSTSELSDEELTRRPADVPPSGAPSIAWHLWHIARWADPLQASLPGMAPEIEHLLGPGRQVWEAENLATRWGFGATAGYRETGMGLDDEESTCLRLPGKRLLLDYARHAFERPTVRYQR